MWNASVFQLNNYLLGSLIFNRVSWWPFVVVAMAGLLILMLYNYASHRVLYRPATWCAIAMKSLGFGLIAICLLEPMNSFEWPRPQENIVGIMVDRSKSMNIGLNDQQLMQLKADTLDNDSPWQRRVAQDFSVRRYTFGSEANVTENLSNVNFDQRRSNLFQSINLFEERMQRKPIAALFVFTDGNATDIEQLKKLQANTNTESTRENYRIYPVLIRDETSLVDLGITQVNVSVANFETSPVSLDVRLQGYNIRGESIVLRVFDQDNRVVLEEKHSLPADRDEHRVQLQFKSINSGVQRYRVEARLANDASGTGTSTKETTLENNSRFVIADRGTGPYRILYISGRPNWEFKFIRRALAMDSEMELVGMIRIAKREGKFTFRDNKVGDTNTLFEGFEDDPDGLNEQADEAVLTRLGVKDPTELKSGFPTTESELYRYHMIVVDDLESEFFSIAQQQLIRRFVSERGGTLLMLGGVESFRGRKFATTSFAQMLPFYFDGEAKSVPEQRFNLTREGWLQPSLRIKDNENAERDRLQSMPSFRSVHVPSGVKPGAIVFANGANSSGEESPLLATQRYGQGKTAAMLTTDFWRWAMRHTRGSADEESNAMFAGEEPKESLPNEALIAWRQMFRWLITDVPAKFDVRMAQHLAGVEYTTDVALVEAIAKDENFNPQDNASVTLQIENPDKTMFEIVPKPNDAVAGSFLSEIYPTQDGAYLIQAAGVNGEGENLGNAETGFVVNQSADEFMSLQPNKALLQSLAQSTGGEVLAISDLNRVAEKLPFMKVTETIRRVEPMWHQSYILAIAFSLLLGEWGLRRWRGLP